jgi:ATP-dependent protease ClpP protease subunit
MKHMKHIYVLVVLLVLVCDAFCLSEEFPKQENSDGRNIIKLTEKNFVVIRGEINEVNSAKVVNQLLSKQRESELYIYLITRGGSVVNGMQIIQALKSLLENKVNVKCIADIALSMGYVIFQYCPVRYVTMATILMQHQLYLGVHGPINQVNNYLTFVKSMEDEMERQQANRIGKTVDEFKSLVAHDWWIFGENNVKLKTADKMTNVLCDFEPRLTYETVRTVFGELELTYSNCPLARDPISISFKNASTPDHEKKKISEEYKISDYVSSKLFDLKNN